MKVFLIHGMGRSRASMLLLGSRLKRADHDVSSFGYTVSTTPFERIADEWVAHIQAEHAGDAPYAIVGHSLGNIITRHVCDRLPAGLSRLVMLAPPNKPPLLARQLRDNFLFKALAGEGGQRLADEAFYETLPVPAVPTLILAGNGGPRLRFLPFGEAEHDGIVALDETDLEGVPRRILPVFHTFIMNDRRIARLIQHFLQTGRVDDVLPDEAAA